MGDNSAIEWTDATWNPITGCTKVSRGCDNCYAERFAERFRGVAGHPFETGFDLTLRPGRLNQPLAWKRPRTIFVNSMSDLFHKEVPRAFIDRVFDSTCSSSRCPGNDQISFSRTAPWPFRSPRSRRHRRGYRGRRKRTRRSRNGCRVGAEHQGSMPRTRRRLLFQAMGWGSTKKRRKNAGQP
jgi:hypothetical protein